MALVLLFCAEESESGSVSLALSLADEHEEEVVSALKKLSIRPSFGQQCN